MEYNLVSIAEKATFVAVPRPIEGDKDYQIHWDLGANLRFPGDNHIEVILDAKVKVSEPEGHPDIAAMTLTHLFKTGDVAKYIEEGPEQASADFIVHMIGISVGTLRGLMYARTWSVLGPEVLLPVINPSILLGQSLPRILKNLEQSQGKSTEDISG